MATLPTAPFPSPSPAGLLLPAIVAAAGPHAQRHFLEFFAATIRNAHTRRAYARGVGDFLDWCDARGVGELARIAPLHVAGWIEELGRDVSVPTVKQRLAAVRHLFDWLVRCQVVPANSAVSVRKRPIPRAAARRRCSMLVRRELLDAASVSAVAPIVRRRVVAVGIATGATIRFTQRDHRLPEERRNA